MWPGLVGKGSPGSEPCIDLDTMLDLTAKAEVNGIKFDGVDLFLYDPHTSIDISDDGIKALADKIRAEAMQPGADFAALARRVSEAPDAARGGNVGVFDRGMMIKSFEDAAFKLEIGDISPVVETRFGFHIIKRIG